MKVGLIADIGGTHARLAMVSNERSATGRRPVYRVETIYECRSLDGMHELLTQYREMTGGEFPTSACLAVAGPIHGDQVRLTNLDWRFSIDDLRSQFGFDRLEVINDLQATACALPHLGTADLAVMKTGDAKRDGTRAVIGVGTGLGVSAAVKERGRWLAIASEGGHVMLAPSDELEAEIHAAIRRDVDPVDAEALLSGRGLLHLYGALAQVQGHDAEPVTAEHITRAAGAGDDPLCKQTVELYCRILGRFAGNTALTFGAAGGVYLTGDLLLAIAPLLAGEHFADRFVADGAMKDMLGGIPVWLITASRPGLIGAQARLAADDGAGD